MIQTEQLSFLLTITGTIIVFLVGYYVFLKDSKRTVNRVFFLFTLNGALWGIAIAFRPLSQGEAQLFLEHIWSITLFFIGSLLLHLVLLVVENRAFLRKKLNLIIIYLPAFLFTLFYFVKGGEFITGTSAFFAFYVFYLESFTLISLITLFRKYSSLESVPEKRKIKSLIIGILIPAITGSTINIVVPSIMLNELTGGCEVIGNCDTSITFYFFTIGYLFIARGIIKWRIFIGYREILETIFERMSEVIIVTDRDGIVVLVNQIALSKCRCQEEEMLNRSIGNILAGGEKKWREIRDKLKKSKEIVGERVDFLTKDKIKIPLLLSYSYGREVIIFVGRDIKELVEHQRELERELTKKTEELQEAQSILEVKVKARTEELEGLTRRLEESMEAGSVELQNRVKELERFQALTIGRELKMVELKKKIRELENNLEREKLKRSKK